MFPVTDVGPVTVAPELINPANVYGVPFIIKFNVDPVLVVMVTRPIKLRVPIFSINGILFISLGVSQLNGGTKNNS